MAKDDKRFFTNGSEFTPSGYSKINAGGSHSSNPNGGVQNGVDYNGTPNLVEQGESVQRLDMGDEYQDFVFSNQVIADADILKEFNIPVKYAGKPYSDIVEAYVDDQRPNDHISNNGMNVMLIRIANAQEEQKRRKEQAEIEQELASMSPEELDQLEAILAQSQAQQQQQQMIPEGTQMMTMQQQGMQQPEMIQQPMMVNGGAVNRYRDGGFGERLRNSFNSTILVPSNPGSPTATPASLPFAYKPENMMPSTPAKELVVAGAAMSPFAMGALSGIGAGAGISSGAVPGLQLAVECAGSVPAYAVPISDVALLAGGAQLLYNAMKDKYDEDMERKKSQMGNEQNEADSRFKNSKRKFDEKAEKKRLENESKYSSQKNAKPETSANNNTNKSEPIVAEEKPNASGKDKTPMSKGKRWLIGSGIGTVGTTAIGLAVPYVDNYRYNNKSTKEAPSRDVATNDTTYTYVDPEFDFSDLQFAEGGPKLPTYHRYAGAVVAGLEGLHDAFQKPDSYSVNHVNPQLLNVRYNAINPVYSPVDQNAAVNNVIASGNSSMNAMKNMGLGPSASQHILALDNNIGKNIGNARTTTSGYNANLMNSIIGNINANRQAAAQIDFNRDRMNTGYMYDAAIRNNANDLAIQQYNYNAEAQKYAAIQNQIDAVAEALSMAGRENMNMNMINDAYDFRVNPDGSILFVPKR